MGSVGSSSRLRDLEPADLGDKATRGGLPATDPMSLGLLNQGNVLCPVVSGSEGRT